MRTHPIVFAAWAVMQVSGAARAQSTIVEPVEPGEIEIVIDGLPLDAPVVRIWSPLCVEGFDAPSEAEFAEVVEMARALTPVLPLEPRAGGAALGNLPFDVQFVVSGAPPGAAAAITAVESYLEATFAQTLLAAPIVINVSFGNLGTETLGATSPLAATLSYDFVQSGLRTRADSDDFLHAWVPDGTTFPVRFDGSSGVVTDFGTMTVPCGNIQAAFFATCGGGAVANVVINTNPLFSWDYDPSDGVAGSAMCFRSVLVHEVGHALGFISRIDAPTISPTILDLFRFQGSANNPTTYPQFGTVARVNDLDDPNEDQIFDALNFTYPLADGSPKQAGHFRLQSPPVGLMDPDLAPGETFHPLYLKTSDLRVFDALGFDRNNKGCMSGGLNGTSESVLFVNDKLGWVTMPTGSMATVRFAAPPAGTDGFYVLWVWSGFEFGIGYPLSLFDCTMRPFPGSGFSPQPIRCLHSPNADPSVCEGVFKLPSPPTIPFSRSKRMTFPVTLTLQGLLVDFGSPLGYTTSNAVILQVQ